MIRETQGDICHTIADAIVVPVNCVGVMGKGVALAARLAFPDIEAPYRVACCSGFDNTLAPGDVLPIRRLFGKRPPWVFCFATKAHWKDPSQLEWIERGLPRLTGEMMVRTKDEKSPLRSVAVPRLGCGAGGLDWAVVGPKVTAAFANLPIDLILYGS